MGKHTRHFPSLPPRALAIIVFEVHYHDYGVIYTANSPMCCEIPNYVDDRLWRSFQNGVELPNGGPTHKSTVVGIDMRVYRVLLAGCYCPFGYQWCSGPAPKICLCKRPNRPGGLQWS